MLNLFFATRSKNFGYKISSFCLDVRYFILHFRLYYFEMAEFRLNGKYMMAGEKAFNNVEMYDWLLTMFRH